MRMLGAMTLSGNDSLAVLHSRTVVAVMLALLFLIAPGALGILQYGGALITQLHWIVFILLSLSLSAPVAVLNVFLIPYVFNMSNLSHGHDDFFYVFVISAIATSLMLCAVLFLSFFFIWTLALACFVVFAVEIILILAVVAMWWKEIVQFIWPR